jgi:hypothetical protein
LKVRLQNIREPCARAPSDASVLKRHSVESLKKSWQGKPNNPEAKKILHSQLISTSDSLDHLEFFKDRFERIREVV